MTFAIHTTYMLLGSNVILVFCKTKFEVDNVWQMPCKTKIINREVMGLKKENMKHPNFIIGLVSFVLLLLGVVMKGNGYRAGDYAIIASVALGFIHWVWSIIDVAKNHHLDGRSRPFWVVMVVIIPPLGGMFYYIMKTKNVVM